MSNLTLDDINISNINALNKDFDDCLTKNYGKLYFSKKTNNASEQTSNFDHELFSIEKNDGYIVSGLQSPDDLNLLKEKILSDYELLTNEIKEYAKRVKTAVDEPVSQGIIMIAKGFNKKTKILKSKLDRFEVEATWNTQQMAIEFEGLIADFYKGFLSDSINTITRGINTHSAYEELLNILNRYLQKMSVYTKHYSIGYKISDADWYFLKGDTSCETQDVALKNCIKDVFSLSYLLGEHCISEAEVSLWKLTK